MVSPGTNRVLDALHRGTVYLLAGSTLYFTVEIFNATYYLNRNQWSKRGIVRVLGPIASSVCVVALSLSCLLLLFRLS